MIIRLRYLGIDWPPLSGYSAVMGKKPRVPFSGHIIIYWLKKNVVEDRKSKIEK